MITIFILWKMKKKKIVNLNKLCCFVKGLIREICTLWANAIALEWTNSTNTPTLNACITLNCSMYFSAAASFCFSEFAIIFLYQKILFMLPLQISWINHSRPTLRSDKHSRPFERLRKHRCERCLVWLTCRFPLAPSWSDSEHKSRKFQD